MSSLAAAVALAAAGCASAPEPEPRAGSDPGIANIVRGSGYTKSVYDYEGTTVVSFGLDVRNQGPDAGRSASPSCHVTVDDERVPLEVLQNPELAPGEKGQFRTGGPIPRPLTHAEVDDLEVYCAL